MATLTKKDLLKEYIRRDFYYSNIDKYRKYFDEWYNNLTEIQLEFWEKRMEGQNMLTKKGLLEAIEDMPMDAEIGVNVNPKFSNIENFYIKPVDGVYVKNGEIIVLEINKSC